MCGAETMLMSPLLAESLRIPSINDPLLVPPDVVSRWTAPSSGPASDPNVAGSSGTPVPAAVADATRKLVSPLIVRSRPENPRSWVLVTVSSMISASTDTCGRSTSSFAITPAIVLKPSWLAWMISELVAASAVTLMPPSSPATSERIDGVTAAPPRPPSPPAAGTVEPPGVVVDRRLRLLLLLRLLLRLLPPPPPPPPTRPESVWARSSAFALFR